MSRASRKAQHSEQRRLGIKTCRGQRKRMAAMRAAEACRIAYAGQGDKMLSVGSLVASLRHPELFGVITKVKLRMDSLSVRTICVYSVDWRDRSKVGHVVFPRMYRQELIEVLEKHLVEELNE